MSKKFRNRFLALVCLMAFAGLGMFYYTNWVVQKPFAVIVFVADNLCVSSLTAARIYGGGSDSRLSIERFPHVAILTTHAADYAVSDLASSSTALATGRKTNNRLLGMDPGGERLESLASVARARGRAVGLVSNVALTDAGPAAFYAATGDPYDGRAIAIELAGPAEFDVMLGGGAADFIPEHKGGRRTDGRDLTIELRQLGYDVVRTKSELEGTPRWRAPKIAGLFSDGNMAFADDVAVAASQPGLADMVRQAIQLLQFNRKGYLLVVDAGLVGKAASQNEGERMLREFLQLDSAVATALAYAGTNSLVVVAGRRNVGGLHMNGFPFRNDKGVAVVGMNALGIPSLTWSSGPGSRFGGSDGDAAVAAEPSAFYAPAALGVAEDVLAVGIGPGATRLSGFMDNTDIFRLVAGGL
jgi:alkaline phosphatase